MQNKHKLKGPGNEKGSTSKEGGGGAPGSARAEASSRVFIHNYLTSLRSRLLKQVKKDPNTVKAFTLDGKVHCIIKDGSNREKVVIENPDELFKLGWDKKQLKELSKLLLDSRTGQTPSFLMYSTRTIRIL